MKGKETFEFQKEQQYVVALNKKQFPWWILLFLLLLLIPLPEKIDFKTVLNGTENVVSGMTVGVDYRKSDNVVHKEKVSDDKGFASFTIRWRIVLQYLIGWGSSTDFPIQVTAAGNCYSSTNIEGQFQQFRKPDFTFLPVDLSSSAVDFTIVSTTDAAFKIEDALVEVKGTYTHTGESFTLNTKTDANGIAHFEKLPDCANVQVFASKEGYYPNKTEENTCQYFQDNSDKRIIPLKPVRYTLDIVMCIDATGSMGSLISNVKSNALTFYSDLEKSMKQRDKYADQIRVKVVSFRDFYTGEPDPLITNDFIHLPKDEYKYSKALEAIRAAGGGDTPESALESVSEAIQSQWDNSGENLRQIIVMWTDAPAHKLEKNAGSKPANYPKNMPANLNELHVQWQGIEKSARLVIYGPMGQYPWEEMNENWNNTIFYPTTSGLRGVSYQAIIDAIAEGI